MCCVEVLEGSWAGVMGRLYLHGEELPSLRSAIGVRKERVQHIVRW